LCTGSIHGKHFGGTFGVSRGKLSQVSDGSQIAERGVRTDGVVDSFPLPEFLIEFGHGFRFFFEQVIELVVVGFVASFEEAVFLGAMGVGEEVGKSIGTGFVEEAEELGAVVGIEVLEGEGEGVSDLGQESFRSLGGGGGGGAEDAEAGAGVHRGELEGFGAVGEAEVFGIELDQGAGSGLVEILGMALALEFEAAEVFFAGFGEEEVVLLDEAAEGGGGEDDPVPVLEEHGELIFGPGGELFAEGDDLVHGGLGEGRGADAVGSAGAVIEGGEVAGVEAAEPLVEGGRGDGEVSAGEAGVAVVFAVEVEPGEAALGGRGKGAVKRKVVEGSGEAENTHGVLLGRPRF
jgi:hypothetical protein